ncbi:ABC transporter ATP-binding protein [Pseudofulvibacter geojedonensis]|uniref:ABC transporter ATP-binding protein n=1 Tax=Pseudofulvibacter geojedonensis TaxID=1123758 RepID=A0ABW3HZM4_9FLAO
MNFELTKGKLIGLIGANGIGKSTLLRTLNKSQKSLSGNIIINNQQLNTIPTLTLATQLSVVLTETISDTNLTVLEIVTLGRQPYTNWIGSLTQEDKEKVSYALKVVNIENLAAKKCFELSDGQLQKVMLARALAQDTDIIILDEPTTHLDLYHKVYILKLLQRLAKETQKTILFSTHEINVALSLCDELIVMKKEHTHFGTPKDLVEINAFDSLFPNDLVEFNSSTNSFSIK